MLAVRDDELEAKRLEVRGGVGAIREAVEDGQQRVRLSELARDLRAPRNVDDAIAAGVTFFEPITSASRSSRSSAMTAIPRFGFCVTSAYAVTCAPRASTR